MTTVVIVVPAGRDQAVWLARAGTFAVANDLAVVAVVAAVDRYDSQARDAIADLIASGVADCILCSVRGHVPDQWVIVEASQPGGTRPTWRRPTVVDRAEPGPVQARPQVRTREAS